MPWHSAPVLLAFRLDQSNSSAVARSSLTSPTMALQGAKVCSSRRSGSASSRGSATRRPPRGLRVGGEVEEDLLRRGQHLEMRLHIVHVAVSARGDDAHLSHIARFVHQGERCAVQADGNAAAARHLIAVTEQAEACHVGAGVDIFGASHGIARLFVERRHVGINRVAGGGGDEVCFDGGREHAAAERLVSTSTSPGCAPTFLRMRSGWTNPVTPPGRTLARYPEWCGRPR